LFDINSDNSEIVIIPDVGFDLKKDYNNGNYEDIYTIKGTIM
jgi:hypothetical protein